MEKDVPYSYIRITKKQEKYPQWKIEKRKNNSHFPGGNLIMLKR